MQPRSSSSAFVPTLFAFVIFGVTAAIAAGGCNMVSGLDSLTQAASTEDGGGGDFDAGIIEVTEGGVVGGPTTSDCTPDPNFCNTHCGNVKDNCGQARACSSDCGENGACDATTHTCTCVAAANFCVDRCGTATDNCAQTLDCGGCDAGSCSAGACGCTPDPTATTCSKAGKQCGSATNNCGQTVFCGGGGSSSCATKGDVCETNGTCCTPNNSAACSGKCSTNVTNNCGQTVGCPATCNSGQVCDGASCCTPEPIATTCGASCGGTKTNNCGQVVSCGCGSGQVCTGGACCTPEPYCTNGHECGSGVNNCGQTISCGPIGCTDVCPSGGGTCNPSTGVCTCRCGVIEESKDGLHTQIQPCLPE